MVENWRRVFVALVLFKVCILGWRLSCINAVTDPSDTSALNVMYSSLNSPSQLTLWSATGGDPCGLSWKGIICSGQRVTELKLSRLGLSGSMDYQLSNLSALTNLDLSNNNLGGDIPYSLPQNLERLNFANNQFTGTVPYSISEMKALKYLNIGHNHLQGQLDDIFGQLASLSTLDLSVNTFSGNLPPSFSSLSSLSSLNLQNNQFSGTIDVLANLPLDNLNIANNFFTGWIPNQLNNINLQTYGNILSSGPAPPSPPGTPPAGKKKKEEDKWWTWWRTLAVIGVALLVPLLFYLCYFFYGKIKAKVDGIMNRKKLLRELEDNMSPPTNYGRGVTQEKDKSMKHELKIFNFQIIVAATNNFSTTNELGKGGFGPVYKGILIDGQEIAIKRLSKSSGQGVEEFKNEAKLIAKLQHTNLVRLLGCSLQGEERILVYEYMPNKSLDFFIFDSNRKSLLNWRTRFNIIEGIAQGLIYLHKYSRLRVIHRDLKASNILLDDQMNPKISDFGLARIFGVNESEANTNRIVGTYGYMSPEYAMNGVVSIKTDVFSFGVLVLEIVSGKKNTSCYDKHHPLNLVGYAWQLMNENKGIELKDSTMDESCSPEEVIRCIHVGLLCVQNQASDRPTMSDVVSMLTNETMTLPSPKQPAFFVNVTAEEEPEISGYRLDSRSVNDVTISAMEAR